MKKAFFVLLFGLMISTFCHAQSFNGGILAGAIASQVDGDSYAGYHQLGFTAGAYINLPIENHLSMQMELKYSLMGAHSDVKEEEEYGYNHYNLRLHYAEIPLMLRYDLGYFSVGGRPLDFISLEAGLSLDFLLKSIESADFEPEIESTDRWKFFSVTANGGLHFAITEHLGVGVRMMYSILPIRINGESPSFWYGHYYNKVLQAVVTYNINASHRY